MIIGATFGGSEKSGDAKKGILPRWLIAKLGITCHRIVMPTSRESFDYFIKCLVSAKSAGLTQAIVEIPMDFPLGRLETALSVLPYKPATFKFGNEQDDPKCAITPAQYRKWFLDILPIIHPTKVPIMTGGVGSSFRWWKEAMIGLPNDVIFDFHVLGNAAGLVKQMASRAKSAKLIWPGDLACTEVGTWAGTQPGQFPQTEQQQGDAIVLAMLLADNWGLRFCCGALWPMDNLGAGKGFEHWGLWTSRGRRKASADIIEKFVRAHK